MPRSAEDWQRLREEQRAHILEAAWRVFARKGPSATMDDIAAEASVSHGLPYRYFVSKEALLSELAKQAFQTDVLPLRHFMEESVTPGERLKKVITALIESRRYPELLQLFDHMRDSEATPEKLREMIYQRGYAIRGMLRQLIVEGQASGEVATDDPDQLVRAILACLNGLVRQAESYPEQHDEHFPDAAIFLRMFKP